MLSGTCTMNFALSAGTMRLTLLHGIAAELTGPQRRRKLLGQKRVMQ